jgi:outer membrane protein assembly factor BamB
MYTYFEEIKKYHIQNNNLFYLNTTNELVFNNKKLNTDVISFRIFNNKLFCQKKDEIEILDFQGNCISKFQGIFSLFDSYITNNFFYILKEEVENDYYYYYFDKDLILKKVKWVNRFVSIIFNNIVLSVKQKDLYCNDSIKGDGIWQTSFKDLAQCETVYTYSELLESNQKIYFQLQSENRKGIFCIDIHTGKEIALYSEGYGFLVQDEHYVYTSKYENILCKINPKTNECEEWDVDKLIKSNGFDSISDHRCVAQDGKLYFTQTLGDTKAKLGVLNTLNKTLIFKHEFEPKNGGISSIQVSEDRIFIHTQDNTLHIFDKV